MGGIHEIAANGKAAVKLLMQRIKRRKPGPIRVGFLCQYIPAWNKAEPVYAAMCQDPGFAPILLCVPSGIRHNRLEEPEGGNDTYEYYVNHGYQAVNTLLDGGQWLDLTPLALDYVFYLRPYDDVMPEPYLSGAVSKIAKICVIMYGMTMTKEVLKVTLEPGFFRNVFCYFAESDYAARVNRGHFPLTHFLGLQRSMYCGIPAMSQILQEKHAPSDAWDFSPGTFRVLWTPRWTTDPKLGGTNFFMYKDWILDYAAGHPDAACLLRPHPMAFQNFISTGEMTAQEVADYQCRCAAMPNVDIDARKTYISTMWHSSVLVSDISGVMPEYFIMNKPLIFCRSNMALEPTGFTSRMLEGCYVVDNGVELEACLERLRMGEDPLRSTRERLIQELFGDTLDTSVASILGVLKKEV